MNTNVDRFSSEQHLLYADFPVESEIAKVKKSGVNRYVGVVSGSANTSAASGDTSLSYLDAYGKFNTRFKPAETTSFISQPYGNIEYNLFKFETISDGQYSNARYKISINRIEKVYKS